MMTTISTSIQHAGQSAQLRCPHHSSLVKLSGICAMREVAFWKEERVVAEDVLVMCSVVDDRLLLLLDPKPHSTTICSVPRIVPNLLSRQRTCGPPVGPTPPARVPNPALRKCFSVCSRPRVSR